MLNLQRAVWHSSDSCGSRSGKRALAMSVSLFPPASGLVTLFLHYDRRYQPLATRSRSEAG
ncbi:hypothetical protein JAAARDRAFT_40301 [Jaapia argillacea MUCL 33604]|uniref:Uncharacterized protein n=1 Tax=Jaapia argillacea MUCL 33604 TaxID=933084 RepID=A0A067PC37_9AGAM|nr:hypothetical protein JAAARDRAFT_40301 [Jaapia argillacea MUCL 33604]